MYYLRPEGRRRCRRQTLKGGNHERQQQEQRHSGGIFWTLLAVAFIVLKVTHLIDWPWVWVLAPIWIPAGIVLAAIVVVLIVVLTKEALRALERRRR